MAFFGDETAVSLMTADISKISDSREPTTHSSPLFIDGTETDTPPTATSDARQSALMGEGRETHNDINGLAVVDEGRETQDDINGLAVVGDFIHSYSARKKFLEANAALPHAPPASGEFLAMHPAVSSGPGDTVHSKLLRSSHNQVILHVLCIF